MKHLELFDSTETHVCNPDIGFSDSEDGRAGLNFADEVPSPAPLSELWLSHIFAVYACGHCGNRQVVPLSCGNRFCSVCQSSRHLRAKRRMKALVNAVKTPAGMRMNFVTLTIPNSSTIEDGVKTLRTAFQKLRASKWWKKKVDGGIFVIEVTKRPKGWHVHAHIACTSRWIKHPELSARWKKLTGAKVVWICPAKVSVVGYLLKYMSKAPDAPEQVQLEISTGLRGVRLFQPFGSWFNIKVTVERQQWTCKVCGEHHLDWTPETRSGEYAAHIIRDP